MGKLKDDKKTGRRCSICIHYFREAHGHPVACDDCWTEDCGYKKVNED